MEQVVRRMDADGRERTRLEDVKSIMKKLNYTADRAMDLLDIPLDEREALKAKL